MRRRFLLSLLVCGCGMPLDPAGSFHRVRNGRLRAGFTVNEPWTRYEDGRPTGVEAELLRRFAEEWSSQIEWVEGSESALIEKLQSRELDVVLGGLKESSPWSSRVAMTRPFIAIGKDRRVIAVSPGENRLLLELDRFIEKEKGELERAKVAEEEAVR